MQNYFNILFFKILHVEVAQQTQMTLVPVQNYHNEVMVVLRDRLQILLHILSKFKQIIQDPPLFC